MEKGQAFLVVGYSNWGKSKTLQALTDGVYQRHWHKINGTEFFLRRMSNDDIGHGYPAFVRKVSPLDKPFLIGAFCPNFQRGGDAVEVLDILRKKYELNFFVIRHAYKEGRKPIGDDVIEAVDDYGTVKIFERRAEAEERAISFRKFIISKL